MFVFRDVVNNSWVPAVSIASAPSDLYSAGSSTLTYSKTMQGLTGGEVDFSINDCTPIPPPTQSHVPPHSCRSGISEYIVGEADLTRPPSPVRSEHPVRRRNPPKARKTSEPWNCIS